MSPRHCSNGNVVHVVAYYRMSDDKQENSIERQREQVERYAMANGYVVVREYIDEGISGHEAEKRPGFMRLLTDATTRRDFKIILCDNKDRFGRFDSIDLGYYVKPLRDAGVTLETPQGRVDWSSFGGRLTDLIQTEASNQESKKNGARVLGGMLLRARQGRWLGGVAPYGYVTATDPVAGKKLVPGDPEKVRAVRLMFTLYEQGHSLDAIAGRLSGMGLLNPRGKDLWNKCTVRGILRCRKYVGDVVWNVGHDGKFTELKDGRVVTSDVRLKVRTLNPAEDWVVVPDVHEAIIDREQWERVQVRLAGNRGRAVRAGGGPNKVYPLAGLLVCGHCGWKMIGSSGANGKHYKCGKYHHMGSHGCNANSLAEHKLVRGVVGKLEAVLLNPAVVKAVRQDFKRKAEELAVANAPRMNQARKKAAELDTKIGQGMERMAVIPPDLLTEYAATVRGWKEERDRLREEIKRLEAAAPVAELNELLEEFDKAIAELQDVLLSGDPVRLRAVLAEWVSRVELHFTHRRTDKVTRSTFREGRMYVRPQHGVDLSCLVLSAASPTPEESGASRSGVRAVAAVPG